MPLFLRRNHSAQRKSTIYGSISSDSIRRTHRSRFILQWKKQSDMFPKQKIQTQTHTPNFIEWNRTWYRYSLPDISFVFIQIGNFVETNLIYLSLLKALHRCVNTIIALQNSDCDNNSHLYTIQAISSRKHEIYQVTLSTRAHNGHKFHSTSDTRNKQKIKQEKYYVKECALFVQLLRIWSKKYKTTMAHKTLIANEWEI